MCLLLPYPLYLVENFPCICIQYNYIRVFMYNVLHVLVREKCMPLFLDNSINYLTL